MDRRDAAYGRIPRITNIDLRTMTGELVIKEKGETEVHTVFLTMEVCDLCNGKGTHVNPSIDAHGLSREDFDADPDFEEDYFAGRYDVPCYQCHGKNVTPEVDETRTDAKVIAIYHDVLDDDAAYARECEAERRMGC